MRIELSQVRKSFGQTQVLRGISLEIAAGRRAALIGPNGSGKSTLLRALLGLVACDGQVLLDGRSVFEARDELAPRLAYVPQVAPALSASVSELVRTVAVTRDLPEQAIAATAHRLELSLPELSARPFRNLSGGMKQKLLIALALAAKPSLLVLDEPTASLDAHARDQFFALMEALPPSTTVVLCSHRLEELRSLADHVIALADGEVTWNGPAARFLSRRVRAVLEVQVDSEEVPWLAARGFKAGMQGWWSRTVTEAEKTRLLPELARELGPRMLNLVLRELESVDVAKEVQHA